MLIKKKEKVSGGQGTHISEIMSMPLRVPLWFHKAVWLPERSIIVHKTLILRNSVRIFKGVSKLLRKKPGWKFRTWSPHAMFLISHALLAPTFQIQTRLHLFRQCLLAELSPSTRTSDCPWPAHLWRKLLEGWKCQRLGQFKLRSGSVFLSTQLPTA